jgi:hypothetical protein
MKPLPQLQEPHSPFERIAFAGPMCTGKTTLANILVNEFGYYRMAFADKLKEAVLQLFGPFEKDDSGRKMLQEFSADIKKWDSQIWIRHLLETAEKMLYDYDYGYGGRAKIVVDDLRFMEEYEALKKNGFVIIGLSMQEDPRWERIQRHYPDTHPDRLLHDSEQGWKQMTMDYWITTNNETAFDTLRGIVSGS